MPQTVRFVRFEGDRVTQLRIAALGKPIVIHDQNEMRGYLDPEDTHEIAMGDGETGQRRRWQRQAADDPQAGRGRAGQPEARAAAGPAMQAQCRKRAGPQFHRPRPQTNQPNK